jgi:hypothetical protein
MDDERKKPVWRWIATALLVALVAYPLSMGPFLWLSDVTSIRARRASPGTWSAANAAVIFIDPLYDPPGWIAPRFEVTDDAWNRCCSSWRIVKTKCELRREA